MGKVYYTKDQSVVKGLVPVISELKTLSEVGKYISKETPVRLINRSQITEADIILLVQSTKGQTRWSAYSVN